MKIHVSPGGDDAWRGTAKRPLKSIQAALDAAAAHLALNRGTAEVRLGRGTYSLAHTITLGPELSGVRLRANDAREVMLNGLRLLQNRKAVSAAGLPVAPEARGRLWRLDLPAGCAPRVLYVNGRRQARAMWPKHARWEDWPLCTPGAHRNELLIPRSLQRRHVSEHDVFLNVLSTPYSRWINTIARIVAREDERITLSRALTPHAYLPPADTIPFRIENALECLTEPGEWCIDTDRGHLYYWPNHGEDAETSSFAVDALSCLVRLQGTEETPVRNVHMTGLHMTGAGGEGAALELAGTEDCRVAGCVFQDLEGHAVQASGYTRGLHVGGCRIHRCGAAGIRLHAPRCSGRVISGYHVIERNEISHCGQTDWHSAGIQTCGSSFNVIRRNHLHDLPYSAIQIGGTRLIFVLTGEAADWPLDAVPREDIIGQDLNIETFKRYVCGHNTIEENRIEDVMLQLDDGGAIYCHASHHNRVRGNIVKRTHRARSYGLYFDDDEIHSSMEGNTVIDAPRIPGAGASIHVHDNARNTVQGNIVLGSPCPFRFPSSYGGHRVSGNTFVMKADAQMPLAPGRNSGRYAETKWDAGDNHFDDNLYWSEDHGRTAEHILHALQERGVDLRSRVGEGPANEGAV